MSKDRPAKHLHPAYTAFALLVMVPLLIWWKAGETPKEGHEAPAPEQSAAGTPQAKQLAPEIIHGMQTAEYRKRQTKNGLFIGMRRADLNEYEVWRHPESVGKVDLSDGEVTILTYRAGFDGELIQLLFHDDSLIDIDCDPGCAAPDSKH
ncbi:hypothetical protein FXN65_10840 [Metapseudomonas lalkuanensis]|uniref:Uncharacterized protein n=1 Tax=Metapseudomonas lalkuanensis TaxID=2604832 RepID=A0A5J6QP00_9GAMM|nr:hypothetical protein [Pseudomonas lalkuanensis]QEY62546.1 hypothetical protein FXN65_10840 [Pseudomonas lalkuanensis]